MVGISQGQRARKVVRDKQDQEAMSQATAERGATDQSRAKKLESGTRIKVRGHGQDVLLAPWAACSFLVPACCPSIFVADQS